MPFDIQCKRTFCASHQLRLPGGGLEPLHGHNFRMVVTVSADELDELGCVMDFHDLQSQLDAILREFNNTHLNDHEIFKTRQPSAELIAMSIAESLTLQAGAVLRSVSVSEAPGCMATYRPE